MAKEYKKECLVCKAQLTYFHKQKPEKCPICKAKYWDKPEDERKLFLIQDKYFESGREQKYFLELWESLLHYSKNIILNKIRNKFIMQESILEEKTYDLTNKFLEIFLENPEYKINYSFGKRLSKIANGVLYGDQKEEKHDSLNTKIQDSDTEFIDQYMRLESHSLNSITIDDPEKQCIKNDETIYDVIFNLIKRIADSAREDIKDDFFPSTAYSLLFLMGIRLDYKRDRNHRRVVSVDDFNSCFPRVKRGINNTRKLIRKILKEGVEYVETI